MYVKICREEKVQAFVNIQVIRRQPKT